MKLTNAELNIIHIVQAQAKAEDYCHGARCEACPYYIDEPIGIYNCLLLVANENANKILKESD